MRHKQCCGTGKVGDPLMECPGCCGTGEIPFDKGTFIDALHNLTVEHGITDAAICGTAPDGTYFGIIVHDNKDVPFVKVIMTTLNIGRLWSTCVSRCVRC